MAAHQQASGDHQKSSTSHDKLMAAVMALDALL